MENRSYDREAIKARSEEVFKQVGLVGLETARLQACLVVNVNVWQSLPYWLRTQPFLCLMNQQAPSIQMGLPNYIAS